MDNGTSSFYMFLVPVLSIPGLLYIRNFGIAAILQGSGLSGPFTRTLKFIREEGNKIFILVRGR